MSRENARMSAARRAVVIGAAALGAVLIAASAATGIVGILFARGVVTPPRTRDEDIRILRVGGGTIELTSTADTRVDGRFGLWFNAESGHVKIGAIVAQTTTTVTRRVIAVDFGELDTARRARLSGWYYLTPDELGFEYSEVLVTSELGPAPAWVIPTASPEDAATGRWVIQVHGRGTRRSETLRAVGVFRSRGYTSMLVSYRNDGDALASTDNRYALGDREWRDVSAAMAFALDNGATSIVLMGWSMGGATALQAATRSAQSDAVRAIALESPVIDWKTTLEFQRREMRLTRSVSTTAQVILTHDWANALTGQATSIDLDRLDFVQRAEELRVPLLILHSMDDGYVPPDASVLLAAARPDIVTFEKFTTARHTKLWNVDQPRWENAIADWLDTLDTRNQSSAG